MLFNSVEFALFLPITFSVFWLCRHQVSRNFVVLIASYIFYGWWDPRFLFLIIASSAIDYCVGLTLGKARKSWKRNLLLGVSLCANLGMLGVFKYYDFFTESLRQAASQAGIELGLPTLNLVLPVGISFYTFQTLSYTIDIYRKQLEPTKDAVAFFAFVAFFPQLVAGPIERASHLLGQFTIEKKFEYESAREGMCRILWGMFKKVVIADQCGALANPIFANYESMPGSVLVLGAIYFAIQIYCDFSGYSDIAIGTAKLFGFELMENFKLPYFSRDPAEFWRRWHVSLSGWFRDYIYVPLGGSRVSRWVTIRNTLIVFLVSGLWHGANWTFVCWGFLHWLYFLPLLLLGTNRRNVESESGGGHLIPSIRDMTGMTMTFMAITLAWVFFRSPTFADSIGYIGGMLDPSLFSMPKVYRSGLLWIGVLFIIEWIQKKKTFVLEISRLPTPVRWVIYALLVLLCLSHYRASSEFIYFQF
ncbi:MAG: MBOAT family O-acyltransferase [Planctomycetota bacterium]